MSIENRKGYVCDLPFHGFYESTHDADIGQTFERDIEYAVDENGLDEQGKERLERLYYWESDMSAVRLRYCQQYIDAINSKFGLDLKYESMESPREYNFSTDRLFAYISESDLLSVYERTDKDNLAATARCHLTPRDGFIPHYSSDIEDWPEDVREWDHNLIQLLLETFFEQEKGDDWIHWVWEDSNGEGHELIEAAFHDKPELLREWYALINNEVVIQ